MAIPGGYQFFVLFEDIFPEGAFVLGVEQIFDWSDTEEGVRQRMR